METNKDSIVDVRSVVEAISSDDNDAPLYQGTTRFLLTLIPHFRKILLSAFECPHCGERNNEVQFAGELQPRGCHYQLNFPPDVASTSALKLFLLLLLSSLSLLFLMLNRQVVKSDTATIKIPELDFEIPPEAQRGSLSTVEGILLRAADEIEALQEERKKVDPQSAESIDRFLPKLRACAKGESPFTIILDDPAGNSFIENPFAPSPDPSSTIKFYERTPEQQASLGYVVDPSLGGEHRDEALSEELNSTGDQTRREPHGLIGAAAGQRAIAQGNSAEFAESLFRYSAPEEVMTFPSTCGTCAAKCETRMFVTSFVELNNLTDIPYFREVIVMASSCDACGYRNSELKPGGRIPEKGKKITVLVKNINDLSRDVIKSDTASVEVPELDLVLTSGTLGGVVTTVEDLERVHGFTFGDSLDDSKKSKWLDFRARLNKLLSVEDPWTLIIDDALANSFVAPATDDVKDDHQLSFEEYERSWEQNEELGLNDIDTSSADAAYESTDATRKEGTTV
ncbi:hypothetical protein TEA_021449 [Camellia sinensis var. sinensis]|uniref:Zinc finger ZPR1-type domain-containing protein n=1 Tax=Camellia sinensis var. sinensis TaxID=542762 RepID=A0A4V3WR08_CAMSN|nr:hypothetical protein TEA_021449 [Camellia sinensis var. sinensis]